MSPTFPISCNKLARAYGVSPQALHKLGERHGLSVAVLADPNRLFEELVNGDSREGKLRRRISDPAQRRQILAQIKSYESH